MEKGVGEHCGVAAVSSDKQDCTNLLAPSLLYRLILSMQHRGQLSAGITTYNHQRSRILQTHKGNGLVNEVFRVNGTLENNPLIKDCAGSQGIGHVRYATCGSEDARLAQPFERYHGRLRKWFSFCFNGNLANFNELKQDLLSKRGYHIINETDTEIIMHSIAREIRFREVSELPDVMTGLSELFDGAYNIAFLDATGQAAVIRDPLGIRPMNFGFKDGVVIAASESNALASCGILESQPLKQGHMILMRDGQHDVVEYKKSKRTAHCVFEWIYFSDVASIIEGKSVYDVRTNLGRELASIEPLRVSDDVVVMSVPETARTACESMAYELGTYAKSGLIRNRYIGRTFIEGQCRSTSVQNKYIIVRELTKNKEIILVDDSLVRGTTLRCIVKFLKDVGGAKKVHVRISCPPIIAPCFYGIDMTTVSELIAPRYHSTVEDAMPEEARGKIAEALEADSLIYQTQKGLVKSIGLPEENLCMACLNAEYPTECGKRLYLEALKNSQQGCRKRTYE